MTRSKKEIVDEIGRLRLYLDKSQQLLQATLLADGNTPAIRLDIVADVTTGIATKLDIPANDPMIALAAIERQFLMEKEAIHFYSIAKILSNRTKDPHPDLHEDIATAKVEFSRIATEPNEIKLVFEGNRLTHGFCLELFQYGRVFHSDRDKVELLKRIEANPFVKGFFDMMVASAVLDYVDPILRLAQIVEEYFRRLERESTQ